MAGVCLCIIGDRTIDIKIYVSDLGFPKACPKQPRTLMVCK